MPDVFVEELAQRHADGPGYLGRHIEHDPASRDYDIEQRVAYPPPKPVLWQRWSAILDQGQLGSCTGNALTGWFGCAPYCTSVQQAQQFNENFAVTRYERATQVDPYPGTYPPDDTGSSGLAVCKGAKQDGLLHGYSWAFTVAGLLHALQGGGVIVGIPWHEGFDNPDSNGVVVPSGGVRGGHEFLIRGVQPASAGGPLDSSALLWADNSWSQDWGVRGSFHFTLGTWDQLRGEKADCTIPHAA